MKSLVLADSKFPFSVSLSSIHVIWGYAGLEPDPGAQSGLSGAPEGPKSLSIALPARVPRRQLQSGVGPGLDSGHSALGSLAASQVPCQMPASVVFLFLFETTNYHIDMILFVILLLLSIRTHSNVCIAINTLLSCCFCFFLNSVTARLSFY